MMSIKIHNDDTQEAMSDQVQLSIHEPQHHHDDLLAESPSADYAAKSNIPSTSPCPIKSMVSEAQRTIKAFPKSCLASKNSKKDKRALMRKINSDSSSMVNSPHVFFKQATRWDESSEELNKAHDSMPQLPLRQTSGEQSPDFSSDSESSLDDMIANFVSNIRMEQGIMATTRNRNSLVPVAA